MLEDHKGILSLRGIFVMIKLTINQKKEKKVFLFNEKEIVIGSSNSSNLLLNNETLSPIHLKIIQENQKYLIYNVANDPFCTINDLPFGKSYIKDKDFIQINDTSILFELAEFETEKLNLPKDRNNTQYLKKEDYSFENEKIYKKEPESFLKSYRKESDVESFDKIYTNSKSPLDIDFEKIEKEKLYKKEHENFLNSYQKKFNDEILQKEFSEEKSTLDVDYEEIEKEKFYKNENDALLNSYDKKFKDQDFQNYLETKSTLDINFEGIENEKVYKKEDESFLNHFENEVDDKFLQKNFSEEKSALNFNFEKKENDSNEILHKIIADENKEKNVRNSQIFFEFSQDLNFQPEPILSDHPINSFESIKRFKVQDFENNPLIEESVDEENKKDSENENQKNETSKKFLSKNGKWKIWLSILIVAFSSFLLISNGVYSRLEEKNIQEEIQAARAVSDIALALTYAQIHHIQPHQQNWSDPLFLKNSIYSILTTNYQPLASIDINGRLNGGNYLLRIYMNRDLSRFLVIAQPEPSLMQWLAPQNAVVVDSKSMVIHLINDLKPLNRLLVNPNSLSGENGREIFEIVKNEKVLPLKKLVDENNKLGFMPPRQLEIMRLGAENYIYNAPRYSQVGEKLMEQAIDLLHRPGGINEIKKLQDEISNISKLMHPVLYTSKGMKVALKAQKALAALLPDQKFLIAYLSFDKDGSLKRSHLIIDPDDNLVKGISKNNDQEFTRVGSFQPLVIAAKAPDYILASNEENDVEKKVFSNIDFESPLFLKLKNISKERAENLSFVSDKINQLINLNLNEVSENFSSNINENINDYLNLNEKNNKETNEKIEAIYREYKNMPYNEFENYLKAAGLKGYIKKKTSPIE